MIKKNGLLYPDTAQIYKCKCGRKILIERLLNGTDHTLGLYVCCWDCLSKEKQEEAIKQYRLVWVEGEGT